MWFEDSLKDLHQMLKWGRKSNSIFFDMNLAKKRTVQKIFLFPVLPEPLLIFKYGNWAQTVLLSKFKFISENIMYRVWCDFAEEGQQTCHTRDDLSRKYFRFRHCSTNAVLFSNTVSENAQTFTSNVKSKCEGRLFFCDVNLQRNLIFDNIRVLGIGQRAFNFNFEMVLRCGRTTSSENNFSCHAIEVACFQTWFMFMAMRLFVELCGVKPSFPKWFREGTTFLETNCIW